mmetsp:Transcript_65108/g.209870  ORF Transcript_65108/g.209870 Transcript_65108/m.209870 type:complete len:372 (-) Transcript_65108:754-1869(-)
MMPLLLLLHCRQLRTQCFAVDLGGRRIQRQTGAQMYATASWRAAGQRTPHLHEHAERCGRLSAVVPAQARPLWGAAARLGPIGPGTAVQDCAVKHEEGIDAVGARQHGGLCHTWHCRHGVLQGIGIEPLAAVFHHRISAAAIYEATVRQEKQHVARSQVGLAIEEPHGIVEIQTDMSVGADVARRGGGPSQVHLAHLAYLRIARGVRTIVRVDNEPGIQLRKPPVDVLLNAAVAPDLAVGVQREPILGSDEQVHHDDGCLLPTTSEVHWALVRPGHQHAQRLGSRGGSTGPRASQLGGDDTQDSDAEIADIADNLLQRIAGTATAGRAATNADTTTDSKCKADLPKDSRPPIDRTVLQHFVSRTRFATQCR